MFVKKIKLFRLKDQSAAVRTILCHKLKSKDEQKWIIKINKTVFNVCYTLCTTRSY